MVPTHPVELLSKIFVIGSGLSAGGGYLYWLLSYSPPSDAARLKLELGGPGCQVVSVRRAGAEFGSRSRPAVRKYEVEIALSGGGTVTRLAGVPATLFGRPELVGYDNGVRRPLRFMIPRQTFPADAG